MVKYILPDYDGILICRKRLKNDALVGMFKKLAITLNTDDLTSTSILCTDHKKYFTEAERSESS